MTDPATAVPVPRGASWTGPGGRPARCRICRSSRLDALLDLGDQPLANAFIRPSDPPTDERHFPLELCRCAQCGHMQLSLTVDPELMFSNYPYVSGTSDTITAHFRLYADDVASRLLPRPAFVVEIGSNDGTLLRAFDQSAIRVLGVEPAENIARLANDAGIPTRNDFFSEAVAGQIAGQDGRADAILANNVVAHIDDLHDLMRGVRRLLKPNGVLIAEFPYLAELLKRTEYDTIYHEHQSYFSVHAARELCRRFELELFDVRRVPVHGGSLRIFAARGRRAEASVDDLLRVEERSGMLEPGAFKEFASRVVEQRRALRALLARLREHGGRIAAYGAAAKGNVLLNYCGLEPATVEYIVDKSPLKQGLLAPGSRIPVRGPSVLADDRPDYLLLLAWNFADEIIRQQRNFAARGGRFIVPIPIPRVIEGG